MDAAASPTEARYTVRAADGTVLSASPGRRSLVTWETVAEMERWAKGSQDDPVVRSWAVAACSSVGDCRQPGEAACKAIEALVRARVEFVQGPYNVQLVHTPAHLVAMPHPAGNCVDMVTLTEAMCLSIGLNPATVRVAFSDDGADPFEHVACVVQCRGEHGGPTTVVLDSTVPADEVEATLRRAVRTHVHEPVGRPAVPPVDGIERKEAFVVQTGMEGCFGAIPGCGAPPADAGKASRCPCGSGRLAGTDGCSQCARDGRGDYRLVYRGADRALSGPRYGAGVPGEIKADLEGNGPRLSTVFAALTRGFNDTIRACTGSMDRPDLDWIAPARSAAIAVHELVLTAEQNALRFRSPEAVLALAAQVRAVLPAESLLSWADAAMGALGVASAGCALEGAWPGGGCSPPGSLGWGGSNWPGRAGGPLGAAESLGARLASALFPASPGARVVATPVLEAFGAGLCGQADFGPVADGINRVVGVFNLSVSADDVTRACQVAAAGQPDPGGYDIRVGDIPVHLQPLAASDGPDQPFAAGSGPFEGLWSFVDSWQATPYLVRLYDREAWVLGRNPEKFPGNWAARRAGDVARGRWYSQAANRFYRFQIQVTGPGTLSGVDPDNAQRTITGQRIEAAPDVIPGPPGPGPMPGPVAEGKGGSIVPWLVGAAAVAAAIKAAA